MRRLRYALGRVLRLVLVILYRQPGPLVLERFGTRYGGWWCGASLLAPGQTALCAGAGEDVLAGFDAGRFEMVPCALWREDGTLRLYAPKDSAHVSHSALNLQRTSQYIEVPSRRVSSLLRVGRRVRALRGAGYALVAAEQCNFVFLRRDAAPGRS